MAEFDHALGRLAATEKHAGQVDVDHGLPLIQAHLADDDTVLRFDEQRILDDAGIVDETIEPAKFGHHLIEGIDHLRFVGDIGTVGARLRVMRLACGHGFR